MSKFPPSRYSSGSSQRSQCSGAAGSFCRTSSMLTGVYSAVVLLYVLVVFAIWCEWPQVLGIALMIIGMIVLAALTPVCGDAAYPDCFKDCPLPAPYFNHHALFDTLFAIGL
mmetsp:Transcript_53417/g.172580  ORF Transcript_53417/g.172580 Transcript_53417/m.172580 type:complete len:112 (-) Transcript_53417:410-745(-)